MPSLPIFRVPCVGEPGGPCGAACNHPACRLPRALAAHPCRCCGFPIYEGSYYHIDSQAYVLHVDCFDVCLLMPNNIDRAELRSRRVVR